ncbi:Coenzyme Q biosynthesis Coq4 [Penicillium bovifimosum]|uniref:4-hydroxy-3-methoxy-5-polyprenylbenzoate decarboxylase n=1 Tax=Penicillium bovifimosum TaxID=126998 RepID=A0A9W9GN60_9EURO|nr:Coenzyme Q biosynthesis Coq4 [Penicillium bovifimosum]KAJ5124731.1 Coenzyme Q biosynthesis Coq4 [Penicillium bovifimosum]
MSVLGRRGASELRTLATSSNRSASTLRPFSVLNRPPPSYPGHVPLTTIERGALAVGSAIGSLINPRRADLIAALGEATATPFFIYRLRNAMLSDPTGRRILRDRPRITSQTLKMDHLRALPENSVGCTYAKWLDREGVSPDTRDNVKYIDNEECAYVMQRYRECHDFYHAVTGLPIFVEGELALKALEFLNTLLPMTGLSLFAFVRMKPAEKERFLSLHLPWAIRSGLRSNELINVYWEEVLEKDVDELRAELNIERPPDLREIRKMMRQQQKREKERQQAASN